MRAALTNQQRQLIDLLLREDFPGAPALRAQLSTATVAGFLDRDGSFSIRIQLREPAHVKSRVPVELFNRDTGIHVLLHVVNGIAQEVEIYTNDGADVTQMPENWEVIVD